MIRTKSLRFPHQLQQFCQVLAVLAVACVTVDAQRQSIFKVSPKFDSIPGPSTGWLPGFEGAFRKQITGFVVRRDLDHVVAYKGGRIDMTARLSITARPSADVLESFAKNLATAIPTTVFSGFVDVPNSPSPGAKPDPWASFHTVTVPFSERFKYTGGTLCLDLEARPVVGNEPYFWYADHDAGRFNGVGISYGRTCSLFKASGETLHVEDFRLRIGNTMRLILLGRIGASPILMIGAAPIRAGVDLSPMGAAGCSMYVVPSVSVGLRYWPSICCRSLGYANFFARLPANQALVGVSLFAQSADMETVLPRSQWTNRAGLTTSNGLELRISSLPVALGLSCVTSHRVQGKQPMPSSGEVRVDWGPVIRFLYR